MQAAKKTMEILDSIPSVENTDLGGLVAALHRSQAVIEFDLSGAVLSANENFLRATGYSLEEIQGQHHRMFCVPPIALRSSTVLSGNVSEGANTSRRSTNVSQRVAVRSGFRLRTTPSSTPTDDPIRWSSLRPISPRPNSELRSSKANLRPSASPRPSSTSI